ncbi:MAG: hypothetical protein F6J93_37065 [Oscillatoria sp. SIO1A7]|nr:hypothetical protein [Oscillatoria sp. SIO1A7]
MARKRIDSQCLQARELAVEQELLESLLLLDATYPWNPEDREFQNYLEAAEKEMAWDELLDEISISNAFTEQLWDRSNAPETSNTTLNATSNSPSKQKHLVSIQESLASKFAALVPISWLEDIAIRAARVAAQITNISAATQLVQCTRGLFPDWAEEDLQVLARPFAYAMRGSAVESTLATTKHRDWTTLSEIERVKLSLAIASFVLAQLENTQ